MKGWFDCDDDGKVIVTKGFVTFTCEEEDTVFQLHISDILKQVKLKMCVNVNGKDIYIDVVPREPAENDSESGSNREQPVEKSPKKEDKTLGNAPTTSKGSQQELQQQQQEQHHELVQAQTNIRSQRRGRGVSRWRWYAQRPYMTWKERVRREELQEYRRHMGFY